MRLRRLVPFILDFGAAFFSSDKFADDVEAPWIEVPKGDIKFVETKDNKYKYPTPPVNNRYCGKSWSHRWRE